jgi:hypothetical protein
MLNFPHRQQDDDFLLWQLLQFDTSRDIDYCTIKVSLCINSNSITRSQAWHSIDVHDTLRESICIDILMLDNEQILTCDIIAQTVLLYVLLRFIYMYCTLDTIHTVHCTHSTCSLFPCFRC